MNDAGAEPTAPSPTVVVVGLGPAGAEFLLPVARRAFEDLPGFVRTARHPRAAELVAHGATALDEHYEAAARFEDVYSAIVEVLVDAARRHGRVAYGVPGSPFVAERTVELLVADERVAVEFVAGMSFLDLVWERLGIDPVASRVRLVDAERFAVDAAGDVGPLLVAQVWSRALLSDIKVTPESTPDAGAVLLHHLGLADERVVVAPWEEIDRILEPDHLTALYIPSLAEPVAGELLRAAEVVRTLRAACPWDAEQTHRSLVRHLLEETYEAIEAIESLGDPPELERAGDLEEELGDVLCQVLFHATIAAEEGLFNLADVAGALADKLIRRHPHVYGGAEAPAPEDVLARWEQQKQEEKARDSLLAGIPSALPALALAAKLERKIETVELGVATTGAEPGALEELLGRLVAGDAGDVGALLFGSIAWLAAHRGVDPEDTLRDAMRAFRERFLAAERSAAVAGTTLLALPAPERIMYWLGGRVAR